jgi:hypothetical protein
MSIYQKYKDDVVNKKTAAATVLAMQGVTIGSVPTFILVVLCRAMAATSQTENQKVK